MWLSRFSRELTSCRANGISWEMSAVRSPRLRNFNSAGTELLIPTPSSAVSHMKTPHTIDWSTTVMLQQFRDHHSNTPIPQFYKHFSFSQSTISHLLGNQRSGNDLAYLMHSS